MRNILITTLLLTTLCGSVCAQTAGQKARMTAIRSVYAKAVEKATLQQKVKQNHITIETKETSPRGEVDTKHVEYVFDVKGNDCQLLMVRKKDNDRYREYLYENGKTAFAYDRMTYDGEISEARYYLADGLPFWRLDKVTDAKTKKVKSNLSKSCKAQDDDMWMFFGAEGEKVADGFPSLVDGDLHLFELDTRQQQVTTAQRDALLKEIRSLYAKAQELASRGLKGTKQTYGHADINYNGANGQHRRTVEFILDMQLEEHFDAYLPVLKMVRVKDEKGYHEYLFENGKLRFAFTSMNRVGRYKKGEYRFYLSDNDQNVPFWYTAKYFGNDPSVPVKEEAQPFDMHTETEGVVWYDIARDAYNLQNAYNSIYFWAD